MKSIKIKIAVCFLLLIFDFVTVEDEVANVSLLFAHGVARLSRQVRAHAKAEEQRWRDTAAVLAKTAKQRRC